MQLVHRGNAICPVCRAEFDEFTIHNDDSYRVANTFLDMSQESKVAEELDRKAGKLQLAVSKSPFSIETRQLKLTLPFPFVSVQV